MVYIFVEVYIAAELGQSVQLGNQVVFLTLDIRNGGSQRANDKGVESNPNEHPNACDEHFISVIGSEVAVSNGCKGLESPVH
jgi:hypothetical protein